MKRIDWALAVTAVAALAWVIVRACLQAITIDEATTFVIFVQPSEPQHWIGSTNNHVLNTALMRLTTRLFAVSEWSARLPAMLGAAIYISACYRFCRRLDGGALLRWAALVCLVGSPFILDYLVAARGYSLALGFLMTALLCDPKSIRGCVTASACIGLCFAANFSFAFACAAVLGGLFLWSWRTSGIARLKLIAAYTLPAALVTLILTAPAILNFPRQELWYGAHSLREAFASVIETQLRHLNYRLTGVPLYRVLFAAQPFLYPLFGAVTLAWCAYRWRSAPPLARLFGGAFAATVLLHVAGFHLAGLLYPLDRTGIFFVPLAFGAIALMAALPGAGWLRRAQVGVLVFVAIHNLACLRLNYFEEWGYDQDTDQVYEVLTCLSQRNGVRNAAAGWPFLSAMNFYRQTSRTGSLAEFVDERAGRPETEVFVIDATLKPAIVEERRLTSVWKSTRTGAQIAVPPEHLERLKGSGCLQ